MNLLSLLILMSVLVFVNRIYFEYKKQHFFSLKMMTKIGTFYFVFLIALYFYFLKQVFWFWLLSMVSIIVFPLLIFFLRKFHQQQFYSEFLRFLSMVILSMQRGMSLGAAMESSLRLGNWKQGQLLRGIYEDVVFSQQETVADTSQFSQYIRQIGLELSRVNQHQHQAIDRLCNFRKNLRDRLIFRQKSRQIWFYFFYQVGVLSLIYLLILSFIVSEYGFFNFANSILLSFCLFGLGVLVTFYIGRNKKWSI